MKIGRHFNKLLAYFIYWYEQQYASIFVIYLSLIILSTSDTFEMKCKTIFDLFNFDKRYVYITPASLNIMIATMVQTISSLVYQQIDKLNYLTYLF